MPVTNYPILAAPGTYKVQARRFWDGKLTNLGDPVEFVLEPIFQPAVAAVSAEERSAFQERATKAQVALMEVTSQMVRLEKELEGRAGLVREHAADLEQFEELVRKAKRKLGGLKRKLSGDELKASRHVQDVPAVAPRVAAAIYNSAGNLHGPTKTHRQQLEIGEQELNELRAEVQQLEGAEFADLRNRMNSAGLPYIPPADGMPLSPERD